MGGYTLIADSGSTKTDWALVAPVSQPPEDELNIRSTKLLLTSDGLNPMVMGGDAQILDILQTVARQIPGHIEIGNIHFYGAGCTPVQCQRMQMLISQAIHSEHVYVNSDMLGAARGASGHRSSIVCILGTGSNSCYYDGVEIGYQVPSLGYLMGDEGSGSAIGRRLLRYALRSQLPDAITRALIKYAGVTDLIDLLSGAYQHPTPNKYLATFARFIGMNMRDFPMLQTIVVDEFDSFVQQVLQHYPHLKDSSFMPVHFVGSVACYFKEQLTTALNKAHIGIGNIMQSPIHGLIKYHTL